MSASKPKYIVSTFCSFRNCVNTRQQKMDRDECIAPAYTHAHVWMHTQTHIHAFTRSIPPTLPFASVFIEVWVVELECPLKCVCVCVWEFLTSSSSARWKRLDCNLLFLACFGQAFTGRLRPLLIKKSLSLGWYWKPEIYDWTMGRIQ